MKGIVARLCGEKLHNCGVSEKYINSAVSVVNWSSSMSIPLARKTTLLPILLTDCEIKTCATHQTDNGHKLNIQQ